jgi:hypothetical protein
LRVALVVYNLGEEYRLRLLDFDLNVVMDLVSKETDLYLGFAFSSMFFLTFGLCEGPALSESESCVEESSKFG